MDADIYNLINTDSQDKDKFYKAIDLLNSRIDIIKQEKAGKFANTIKTLQNSIETENKNLRRIYNDKQRKIKQEDIKKMEEDLASIKKNALDALIVSESEILKTHNVFLNYSYKPFVDFRFEYVKNTPEFNINFGTSFDFSISNMSDFIGDMYLHIKTTELLPNDPNDKVCYISYIGHKLMKNVRLIINNKVIDEYDSEFYNVYYEKMVPETKKKAWKKCMGQEIPINGYLINNIEDNMRELRQVCNGNQTLKNSQEGLDLFIPLLFWFNLNPKHALPNNFDAIKVRIELEDTSNILTCIDTVNRIHNEKYKLPSISNIELYTRHYYAPEDVKKMYFSKLNNIIIRNHNKLEKYIDKVNDSINLSSVVQPIEHIFTYIRPDVNITGEDNGNIWYKNSIQSLNYINTPVIKLVQGVPRVNMGRTIYYDEKEIINSLDLLINGTSYFKNTDTNLYNSYFSYLNKYTDNNYIYSFPFNLSNKTGIQPMGYLSDLKQTYIKYVIADESYLSQKLKLYIHTINLNVLKIENGTAILKFIV